MAKVKAKNKCCKECPEYDLCDNKKGCCDLCDFYNTKTKKCAYIKKTKKGGKEDAILRSRRKLSDDDLDAIDEEKPSILEDENGYREPYEDEEMDEFFNT